MAQGRKREVDLRCFFQSVASCASFGKPLATGQVNHIQLTHTNVLLAVSTKLTALDCNLE